MATTVSKVVHTPAVHNPGTDLDLAWVASVRVNRSAAERRAQTLPARRTVKREWQVAWLLRAVRCLDLTTLSGDDTPSNVRRLAAKARQPVRPDILKGFGVEPHEVHVAAVCVYPNLLPAAREALAGCAVRVASVAAGFPAAQTPFRVRLLEVEEAARAGADEVDVVVSRAHVLWGDWRALYEEVRAFREAAGSCHLKTILGTGELPTLRHVAQAALVCMMAGADFVKTSTGKEAVNATLPVGLVMVRQVRDYHARTGYRVGFKPAGGIRTAKQALEWLALVREELGESWTRPETFRIGASSLLTDLERQLSYHLTGRYSAAHHHPMP
ncbi:Deoxyribose-phosphate aldolase [bacterium HR32]|jgi:deoxyribose-phosphate aldolase|nr:Deoxyribose-phosphate aldolase [bacterium HR32]